ARNTAALALTVDSASHVAFYNCTFFGFQDTVLIKRGAIAYFKSCWIEGSVDFIWGYGTAFFDGCAIASNTPGTITAHNRDSPSAAGAFVFNSCNVISVVASGYGFTSVQQADDAKRVYLGRPYSQYARVVYMFCTLGAHINPAGWEVWSNSDPRSSDILFGEYENVGTGASGTRASFATALTSTTVQPFGLETLFGGDVSWIDTSAISFHAFIKI
ncbi:pectin lyase fold/virulence factor, partial [Endogone sp. FLAS-F59071]